MRAVRLKARAYQLQDLRCTKCRQVGCAQPIRMSLMPVCVWRLLKGQTDADSGSDDVPCNFARYSIMKRLFLGEDAGQAPSLRLHDVWTTSSFTAERVALQS